MDNSLPKNDDEKAVCLHAFVIASGAGRTGSGERLEDGDHSWCVHEASWAVQAFRAAFPNGLPATKPVPFVRECNQPEHVARIRSEARAEALEEAASLWLPESTMATKIRALKERTP